MDRTPIYHGLIAAAFCLVGALFGEPFAGATFGAGWFMSREQTQAEYKWIKRFTSGRRIDMPWWGGFDPRVYDLASVLDFIPPLLLAIVVFILTRG